MLRIYWVSTQPMEANMFTLLADAMFAATLARRGSNIPDHLKDHGERYVPRRERQEGRQHHSHDPYRNLW